MTAHPERRRRPITVAIAADAVHDNSPHKLDCASCGNETPLAKAWMIPEGYIVCSDCAAPVMRVEFERRLEMIRLEDAQDAGGRMVRAVALPPALAGIEGNA